MRKIRNEIRHVAASGLVLNKMVASDAGSGGTQSKTAKTPAGKGNGEAPVRSQKAIIALMAGAACLWSTGPFQARAGEFAQQSPASAVSTAPQQQPSATDGGAGMDDPVVAAGDASAATADSSDEVVSIPLEPVDDDDGDYQEALQSYQLSTDAPQQDVAQLRSAAKALLDAHLRSTRMNAWTDSLARGGIVGNMNDHPVPNEIATALNDLVRYEQTNQAYQKTRSGHYPNTELAQLTQAERESAARYALDKLNVDWIGQALSKDDVILALYGTSSHKEFVTRQSKLTGGTLAQAQLFLNAAGKSVFPALASSAQDAAGHAFVQSLDPTLNVLPAVRAQQIKWGSDQHLLYRLAYKNLRIAGIQQIDHARLDEAAQSLKSKVQASRLAAFDSAQIAQATSRGQNGEPYSAAERDAAEILQDLKLDFALISGKLVPAPTYDEATLDRVDKLFATRIDQQLRQKLNALAGAADSPPPSFSDYLTDHGRTQISGRDTVKWLSRSPDNHHTFEHSMTLQEAFSRGAHESRNGSGGRAFRQTNVLIEVENSRYGRTGTQALISSRELTEAYLRDLDSYHQKMRNGADAQLQLLFGDFTPKGVVDIVGFLAGRYTERGNGDSEVKLLDSVVIVLLQAPGAAQPQPYKVELKLGQLAQRTPMIPPEAANGGDVARRPEEMALAYVRAHPEEFFARATLGNQYGVHQVRTGSAEEVRDMVLAKVGWKQLFEQAKQNTLDSMSSDNPVLEAIPLYGCIENIKDTLSDRPMKTEAEAFLVGLQCGADFVEVAAQLGLADLAVDKMARSQARAAHLRPAKSRPTWRVPEVKKIAQETSDGTQLSSGRALRRDALVRGTDGRNYLKATGGEAGGIFYDRATGKFLLGAGNFAAEVDLTTGKPRLNVPGYRPSMPDAVAVDGRGLVRAAFYGEGESTRVLDRGRLHQATQSQRDTRNDQSTLQRDSVRSADGIARYRPVGDSSPQSAYYRLRQDDGSEVWAPPIGNIHFSKVPPFEATGPDGYPFTVRWEHVGALVKDGNEELYVNHDGKIHKLKNTRGHLYAELASPQFVAEVKGSPCAASGNFRGRRSPTQQTRNICRSVVNNRALTNEEVRTALREVLSDSTLSDTDRQNVEKNIRNLEGRNLTVGTLDQFSEHRAAMDGFRGKLNDPDPQEPLKLYDASKGKVVLAKPNHVKNVAAYTLDLLDDGAPVDGIGGVERTPHVLISGAFNYLEADNDLAYQASRPPNQSWTWATGLYDLSAMHVPAEVQSDPAKPNPAKPRSSDTEMKAMYLAYRGVEKIKQDVQKLPSADERTYSVQMKLDTGRAPCLSCQLNMDEFSEGMKSDLDKFNQLNSRENGGNGIKLQFSLIYYGDSPATSAVAAPTVAPSSESTP